MTTTTPTHTGTKAPARPSAISYSRTTATATRVLRQLRHDPRTIALMILIPCLMLVLLRYVFDGSARTFDSIGASLLGIFPLITMFLVTSIATLRERTSGTLERLLAMPLGKGDLIAGYALAFGAVAVVQSALATGLAVWFLGLDVMGSPGSCCWWPCSTPCSARPSASSSRPSRPRNSRRSSSCRR